MNISRETRWEGLVERHPAARVVLSHYGLDSYEEAEPPRESVAQFAEDRSILAERLLEEFSRVVNISRQEPPPSTHLRASSRCWKRTSGWTSISCCTRRPCSPGVSRWHLNF